MKYNIIKTIRNKQIKYTNLPIRTLQSWSILATYAKVYFYSDGSYYDSPGLTRITSVIITYDSTGKQNLLYNSFDGKIIPLSTHMTKYNLYDTFEECLEACMYEKMQEYKKDPVLVKSDIPYTVNMKKRERLYKEFKEAYNNVKVRRLAANEKTSLTDNCK